MKSYPMSAILCNHIVMIVKESRKIERMFSAIAPTYDLLNSLLSAGRDRSWRKKAVESLAPDSGVYLDIATGTGDMALEITRKSGRAYVVGIDLSREMLLIGKRKTAGKRVEFGRGDALKMAFGDGTFDGITCAYGIRNFEDLPAGLMEMLRVLKPGGMAVVLEFTTPANPLFRAAYLFYFTRILPLAGRLISGHAEAYSYLPKSAIGFPDRKRLAAIFREAGFEDVSIKPLTFGICDLVTARKPA